MGLLDGFIEGFIITVIDGGESGSVNAVSEFNDALIEATVYPNPVTEWLAISGLEPNVVWKANLMNLSGQAVREFKVTEDSQMNVSGIPSGLYLLQMIGENTAAKTLRVVID